MQTTLGESSMQRSFSPPIQKMRRDPGDSRSQVTPEESRSFDGSILFPSLSSPTPQSELSDEGLGRHHTRETLAEPGGI